MTHAYLNEISALSSHFSDHEHQKILEREREEPWRGEKSILTKIRAPNSEAHEEKSVVRRVAFNLS